MSGIVKKKVTERGFGFIHAGDGRDYFFHFTDLETGLDFNEVEEGLEVEFVVKREPGYDKAGAAHNVRRHGSSAP
ncbi:MAG: cold-shock protein [Acidobacteria bacterium]|nr:MAG: cold-shock protein [Acidobacteriota bacterium]